MANTRELADPAKLDQGLEVGLIAFRWAAWAWMAIVAVAEREHITHPLPATVLILAALAVTCSASAVRAAHPDRGVRPAAVVVELVVGAAVLVGGAFVQDGEQSQSLGSAWPLAGPLAAGLVFGARTGVCAGVALGVARGAAGFFGRNVSTVSVLSSAVLYGFAGGVSGWVAARLRREAQSAAFLAEVESSLAVAREREDVARTLHDGVLQTLAVVQRRSTDPELAALARRQELELRSYLFGSDPAADLVATLRLVAARHEEAMGTRVSVVCPDDLGHVGAELIDAMRGAVTEALTNAAKHGPRHVTVTVFVEASDDGVFVSVKDDGVGFDPAATDDGVGLARSIRARMRAIGGRVEVESHPGSGAEVRLWSR